MLSRVSRPIPTLVHAARVRAGAIASALAMAPLYRSGTGGREGGNPRAADARPRSAGAAPRLRAAGFPPATCKGMPPRPASELLMAHALGIERLGVSLQYDRPLGDHELDTIRILLRRRGRVEPIAHLTGRREFYGRSFRVTPAGLIPRPETETLVERAIKVAREQGGEVRIADLGTGSGCPGCPPAPELPGR